MRQGVWTGQAYLAQGGPPYVLTGWMSLVRWCFIVLRTQIGERSLLRRYLSCIQGHLPRGFLIPC